MELRHLRYVVAVAEELHFGRAAERLHISQPPLSQQIKHLEEELGVKLFTRTKRQVRMTEAGRRFAEEARRCLVQADHAVRVASRANGGEIGHLVIGTVTAEKTILIESLKLFAKRFPDVHVELRSMSTTAQLEAIREGRIQVGFVILPVDEASLAVEIVAREPLVVAMPENHPLSKRRRVPLAALAGERSILFPRPLSPGYYDRIIGMCRTAGFILNVIHEMDNIYTALALVEAGLGVSLFPASMQNASRKGVVFRELEGVTPPVECAVAFRREDPPTVLVSFLSVVSEIVGESLLHRLPSRRKRKLGSDLKRAGK